MVVVVVTDDDFAIGVHEDTGPMLGIFLPVPRIAGPIHVEESTTPMSLSLVKVPAVDVARLLLHRLGIAVTPNMLAIAIG